MDAHSTIYYGAWLAGLLAAIAFLSAAITRHKRRSDRRRRSALDMVRAVHAYGDWVNAQRLSAPGHHEEPQPPASIEAVTRHAAPLPELDAELAALVAVHDRFTAFLRAQRVLWQHDPAQWDAAEHDRQFMALWRLHRAALQGLEDKLQGLATIRRASPEHGAGPGTLPEAGIGVQRR